MKVSYQADILPGMTRIPISFLIALLLIALAWVWPKLSHDTSTNSSYDTEQHHQQEPVASR